MSADEFDPDIERLFARAPMLPDAEAFAGRIEGRLGGGARLRALALALAGAVGGVVAVGEGLGGELRVAPSVAPEAGRSLADGAAALQSIVTTGLDQAGVSGVEFGSMGAMQLFWVVAGVVVMLAAAGAVRLFQEA